MTEQMKIFRLAAEETMAVNLGREFVYINITDPWILLTPLNINFIMHFIITSVGLLQLRWIQIGNGN